MMVALCAAILVTLGSLVLYTAKHPVAKPPQVAIPEPIRAADLKPKPLIESFKSAGSGLAALEAWGVSLTMPVSLDGKAYVRYLKPADQYVFSTKAILSDEACAEYVKSTLFTGYGPALSRYSEQTPAKNHVQSAAADETLATYFTKHRATKTANYFVDPANANKKFYKVGTYFYTSNAVTPEKIKSATSGFTAKCADEQPTFQNAFLDMLSTLSEIKK